MPFKIPFENLDEFEKKFAKLNKLATKLGVVPATFQYGEVVMEPTLDKEGKETGEFDKYQMVEVFGSAPKLAGWTFIATLDHHHSQPIIHAVAGNEIPERYYTTTASVCEHCGKVRKRVETYIVKNEEGEVKQVGKSCLRDFLGHQNPEKIAEWLQYISNPVAAFDDEEWFGGGRKRDPYLPMQGVVGYIVRNLERYGFVSNLVAKARTEAGNFTRSTTGSVLEDYGDWHGWHYKKQSKEFPTPPSDEDIAKGMEAVKYLASRENPRNNYEHNVKTIASDEYVIVRDFGLLTSAMQGYFNYKVVEARKAAEKAARKPSNYVGEIGQRITVKVRVEFHTTFESDFGTTHLFKMADENDNVFVWFGSGQAVKVLGKLAADPTMITIIGTVKKQDEYKEVKQTTLSRVKIVEEKK